MGVSVLAAVVIMLIDEIYYHILAYPSYILMLAVLLLSLIHIFTEQLHEITARYDSLQLVYISIDKPETADRWTKAVEKHALAGWHIRAGQSLLEDITQKVYQNRNITIPRYILLAPSGEIVCPDLPRPNRYMSLIHI